ncbi:MAG: type II toxin-antitoxin system Phd/YefM family antitoxin [Acidobacteriota bacterium]|nr:type II toxin-antitoxin system Phd/YefM family antitoxin [Acidobacteriota bacterium]
MLDAEHRSTWNLSVGIFTRSCTLEPEVTVATETLSLTEMRPRLSELLARAHEHFDRFVITRRGRAEAVLLSSEEFDGLLETLEILSDKTLVKRLVEADEELSGGGGHTLEDVRRELSAGRP